MIWLEYLDEMTIIRLRSTCRKLSYLVPVERLWEATPLGRLVTKNHVPAIEYRTSKPLRNTYEHQMALFRACLPGRDIQMLKLLMHSGKKWLKSVSQTMLDSVLFVAEYEKAKWILHYCRDPRFGVHDRNLDQDNACIRQYCFWGDSAIVRTLLSLETVDPTAKNNQAIRIASERGHLEIVRMLVSHPNPKPDPTVKNNYCLRAACHKGYLELVKYLTSLSSVDPAALHNEAIQSAVEIGHLEIVKHLASLPSVDPFADDNYCHRTAVQKGYREIAEFLESLHTPTK